MPRQRLHFASLLCAALLAAPLALPGTARAQESSITVLGAPEGPSSGETLPAEAAAETPGEAAPAEDAAAAAAPAEPATPPPCGTQPITIARMQWPTAALLTEIHARILRTAFGCDVQVQEGDLATVGSSMGANGQPAVAPEMWIARIAEIWNAAIKAQEVRQAGSTYAEQMFEGWFVPDYAVEAWPDIVTVEGLRARAPEMAGGLKPKFITCPVDWACNIINRNLLRANGLDQLFEVVEPANRFELDTLIAEAVGRREPIVFYYWQPNAILAQFSFREVALGPYDRDNFLCLGRVACATPLPTGFAPDPVIIAVSEWVYTSAPLIASYFQKARMPFAEMNAMLQQLSETGATVESVADRFIAERGAVWRPWAGLPVDPAEAAAASEVAPAGESPDAAAPDAEPPPDDQPQQEPPARRVIEEDDDFGGDEAEPQAPTLPPPSLAN